MHEGPIEIRAHSLLCLQGFRGEGYSSAFVARMGEIHHRLRTDPEQPVRILVSPDELCAACPHLEHGCTLGGPGHEAHMRAQDEAVLARLDLQPDSVHPWQTVLERIRMHVRGGDLPAICTTCPWLPLGWCAEGIEALRDDVQPPPGS
ncbi:MAG: DUF1284 domain-containing protein [Planctomycetota bacterium]|jgi:hypothetical protein